MAKAKPAKSVSSAKPPRKPRAITDNLTDNPADPVSSMCAKERENNEPEASNQPADDSGQQPSPQLPPDAVSSMCHKGEKEKTDNAEDSNTQSTPPATEPATENTTGDVALAVAESATEYSASVHGNLPLARVRDGETRKQCWERLRQEGRTAGMNRRQAISYAGVTVDQVWFPPPEPEVELEAVEEPEPIPVEEPEFTPEPEGVFPAAPASVVLPIPSDQGVEGLGTLPEAWGSLPANASLQVEISWVSANRLRVRDGTGVDLSRALSPAPSYSALSWLETSILFPSKFADISVKATANQDDEKEAIRREKLSIEEIRGLLAEMLDG